MWLFAPDGIECDRGEPDVRGGHPGGWFVTRNRVPESILLLLVTFTLFRPGFWMDMLYPPYQELPASELTRLVEEAPRNDNLRIWVEGISLEGEEVSKGMLLPLGDTAPSARERLGRVGLTLMSLGDEVQVAAVRFGSQSEKLGLGRGKIARIEVPSRRPSVEGMDARARARVAGFSSGSRRLAARDSSRPTRLKTVGTDVAASRATSVPTPTAGHVGKFPDQRWPSTIAAASLIR